VSAGRVHGTGRRDRSVWIRFDLDFLGVDLILSFLNSERPPGLVDGPPSTNFLFISSFYFRRARISSSFFRLVSSFFLFISTISFCIDIKSVVWAASDIFSFTMLRVDTIYFLFQADSVGPRVGANYSRTGLEPRELLELLLGRSGNSPFLLLQKNSLLPFYCSISRFLQSPGSDGTCKRNFDAQVSI